MTFSLNNLPASYDGDTLFFNRDKLDFVSLKKEILIEIQKRLNSPECEEWVKEVVRALIIENKELFEKVILNSFKKKWRR